MDLSQTIIPNSAQVNADDLIASSLTVTITGVEAGSAEQPVFVHLAEIPDRTWRPSKSMRRVLIAGWGPEASTYVGHRVTLFRNPEIRFGSERVGGIEVSHMSHIDKPLVVALTASRGKRKQFTVQPLQEPQKPAQRDWLTDLKQAAGDVSAINALGHAARAGGADNATVQRIREAYNAAKEAEGNA
jgi:hypothetical protein